MHRNSTPRLHYRLMDTVSSCTTLTLVTDGQECVNPFNSLPNEILELIFSHIRAKTLVQNILPVCRRFYSILIVGKLWYRRLKSHPLKIRLCEAELCSDDFSILRTIDAIESEKMRCENWNGKERYVTAENRGAIWGLKLFKDSGRRFCLSGGLHGRLDQYSILLWSVDKISDGCAEDDALLFEHALNMGEGVSGFAMNCTEQFACNHRVAVKLWDIGQSTIRETSTRSYLQQIDALSLYDRILACATANTSVSLLDVRNGLQEIARCKVPASQYSTQLHLKGNILYMLSDRELTTGDIRMPNEHLQTYNFDHPDWGHHMSLDVGDGLVHCCHVGGGVTVLRERDLQPCYTFKVGVKRHKKSMVQLRKCKGSILALTHRTLQAHSLGSQPVLLGSYDQFKNNTLVMDELDGTIVVGDSEGSMTAWTKKY